MSEITFTIQNVANQQKALITLNKSESVTSLYQQSATAHNIFGSFRLLANGRVLPNDATTRVEQLAAVGPVYLVPASVGSASVMAAPMPSPPLTAPRAVKVFFGDECRRFRLTEFESVSFEALQGQLCKLYPNKYHPEMRLQYDDSDGDRITVQSNVEWQECKRELGAKQTVRLFVVAGNGAYFKDGPAPQVLGFYKSEEASNEASKLLTPVNDESKNLQAAVPRCLSRLFPGGKILPYNVPEWLQSSGAVNVITRADGVADVDINLMLLWKALSQKALQHFEVKEFDAARDMLASMTEWQSTSSWAWYNLACAHALLGDTDNALLSLQCALDSGYANIAHMLKDEDLASIRGTRGFTQLINAHISKLDD